MHDLDITWPGNQARFTPDDSPIRVGRSPEAAIILTEPSVSRRHLEFVWSGLGWTANDYSTHGTFDPIGVRLSPKWTVGTDTTIRLGGSEGIELKIVLLTIRQTTDSPVQQRPPSVNATPDKQFDLGAVSSAPPASPQIRPTPLEPKPLVESGAAQPSLAGSGAHANSPLNTPDSPTGGLFGSPPSEPSVKPADQGSHSLFGESPQPAFAGSQQSAQGLARSQGVGPAQLWEQRTPSQTPPEAEQETPMSPLPAPPKLGVDIDLRDPSPPHLESPAELPQPGTDPAANLDLIDPSLAASHPPIGQDQDSLDAASARSGTGVTGSASATTITDSTLRISVDGNDYVFMPGTEVTVGRDPSCLVAIEERHSLVSRRHLKLVFRDNCWWIDDYSSKGTFVDGRQISGPYRAEGAFVASMGDDEAGTPMRIITAGEHQAPRQRQNLLVYVAIGILALVALGALILALQSHIGDSPTSDSEINASGDLDKAKQATVLLLSGNGLGSGFFVTENLIVTNQHVSAIDETLHVAVSRSTDEPASIEYLAETVALHPFLDIALLKLTEDNDGNPVTSSGLTPLVVASDLDVTLGDKVYSTGFPNQLSPISSSDDSSISLPAVSVTSGEAANFFQWPGCSNPSQGEFIPEGSPPGVQCSPDGDVAKAIMFTTLFSGQGASGGPVFKENGSEVIAVVFAGPQGQARAGRNISSNTFNKWLDEAIAEHS